MVKRAANQGWRNGGRLYASVFSLPYEYVKNAFRRSSRNAQFEALCEEMDRILQLKEELGGGSLSALPENVRRRYVELILEAQELFSKVLNRSIHLPPDLRDAAAALRVSRASSRRTGGSRTSSSRPSDGQGGGKDDFQTTHHVDQPQQSQNGAGSGPASSSSSPQQSQSGSAGGGKANSGGGAAGGAGESVSRVYVPFRDDAFEQEANERLRNLKNKHEGEIARIVAEANEKLRQFQDEHKLTYDKKIAEARAQQHAELEQLHRDLQEQKDRSDEGKEHYRVVSDLLTETKSGLKLLDDDLQVISASFFTIEQLLERTNEEKRLLDRISDTHGAGGGSVNLLSSSSSPSASSGGGGKQDLRAAFQALQHSATANEQSAQAAMVVRERTSNGERITQQLDDLLNRCHTTLSASPTGALFESQHRLYTDYLKSYEASMKDSNDKLVNFSQEIDAKMLALTYAVEELHTKALSLLESTATYLANDYSQIQTKAGELEQSYQDFLQASTHLEEQAAGAAQTALEDRLSFSHVFSELNHAFHELQTNLQRQEDNIKQLSTDISNLERTALVFMDGLNSLPPPVLNNRDTLQQLNVTLVNDMLRFFSSYKQQITQATSALRQRFQVTQDLMRKLELLSREIKSLSEPALLERLEGDIVSLVSELESKQQDYAEADNELKQALAVLQTVKRNIRALEQKLSTERTAAARAAGMAGGGVGSIIGGGNTFAGGLVNSSANGSSASEAVYEIESDLRHEKNRLRDAENDKQEKQRRFNHLDHDVRELQREIDNKRRTMADEQQKLARLEQLAHAVLGGPGSVTGSLAGGIRGTGGSMAGGVGALQRLTAQGGLAGGVGTLGGGVRGIGGTSLAGLGGASLGGGLLAGGGSTTLGGLRSSSLGNAGVLGAGPMMNSRYATKGGGLAAGNVNPVSPFAS